MTACEVADQAFTMEGSLRRQHSRIADREGLTPERGELQVAESRNVGAPTFKVLLEVGLSRREGPRGIPRVARNDRFVIEVTA